MRAVAGCSLALIWAPVVGRFRVDGGEGFERQCPAAVLHGDSLERQTAAYGVEFVEFGMNFSDGDGMFAEAWKRIFPAAIVRQEIAGEDQVADAGEGGFDAWDPRNIANVACFLAAPASADITRELTSWQPRCPGPIEDIRGNYVT